MDLVNAKVSNLKDLIAKYNPSMLEEIMSAIELAKSLHSGQVRKSGDPYIVHPLEVATVLAEMHADKDTVCAGLFHDLFEDTVISYDELVNQFSDTIAHLVDGVTKIDLVGLTTKEEQNYAYTRKILESIMQDPRILIIKLADRLHNMRTLEFVSPDSQKKKATETYEIFVPLALHIGAYNIKSELEDLSLRYIKPVAYKTIKEMVDELADKYLTRLELMKENIYDVLKKQGIESNIFGKIKNVAGIYRNYVEGMQLRDMHDLLALKVAVESIENCYASLGLIHGNYPCISARMLDFIHRPKSNGYRAFHTSVFDKDIQMPVQAQIQTHDMRNINNNGITAFWRIYDDQADEEMLKSMQQSQVIKRIADLDIIYPSDRDFVQGVIRELLSHSIKTFTMSGDTIELPQGSTIIDFMSIFDEPNFLRLAGAYVNGELHAPSYVLPNKAVVQPICNDLMFGNKQKWYDVAVTAHAKNLIAQSGLVM